MSRGGPWKLRLDLGKVTAETREAGRRGLLLAAEHVLGVSNQHVPIEEGVLERSGRVTLHPTQAEAVVSYDTPYAVRQHEDMSLKHDAGRSAKYLENALNSERDTVLKIIGNEMREQQ